MKYFFLHFPKLSFIRSKNIFLSSRVIHCYFILKYNIGLQDSYSNTPYFSTILGQSQVKECSYFKLDWTPRSVSEVLSLYEKMYTMYISEMSI